MMPICGAELPDSLEELLGAEEREKEEKKGKKEGRRQI
jgi:hypothetical protein